MNIVSFNVNSVRLRLHQLEKVIEDHNPDVIALQETKVQDHEFPHELIMQTLGYHSEWIGQKTHYGVALLSKKKPLSVKKGFSTDNEDAQKRMIIGEYAIGEKTVTVINGYFPQGESRDHEIKFPAKQKFYQDLMAMLNNDYKNTQDLIVLGDLNIAPVDNDIGIGEPNAKRWLKTGKTSFLPEEREWFKTLLNWGLTDTFRELYPNVNDKLSWFDYRSKGFLAEPKRGLRIDQILVTPSILKGLKDSGMNYDVREMEKSSDHCPIWSSFKF